MNSINNYYTDLIAEVLYISFLAVEKNPEKCVKHINIYLLY